MSTPDNALEKKVAVVTGTSRDVGEFTAYDLGQAGWDILGIYRNPQHGEDQAGVVRRVQGYKVRMSVLRADLLDGQTPDLIAALVNENFNGRINALVLNAAGGYKASVEEARQINVTRQLRLVDKLLQNLTSGSVIVYNNSYPAHRFGILQQAEVELLGDYLPVAKTKYEAESILRSRIPEFTARGIRLALVVGNGLDGTFVTRVLKRKNQAFVSQMLGFSEEGYFPTVMDMAAAVGRVVRGNYHSGHTEYVGIKPEYHLHPARPAVQPLFGPPSMEAGSILSREEMYEIIPHRWPFMFIGGVQEIKFGESARGSLVDLKHPDINWTAGHFPGHPLVPGVITQEALQQLGALTVLGLPEYKGKLALLTGVDGMRFKRPIIPGEDVRLEADGMGIREIRGQVVGQGHIRALNAARKVAVEGNILFALSSPG